MKKNLFLAICTIFLLGCSTSSYKYIDGAELSLLSERSDYNFINDRDKEINLLLQGHYLEQGKNTILMLRTFDAGEFLGSDDETFQKLSIELQDKRVGVPIDINTHNIKFYYSSGVSGFIYRGHGVYSKDGTGKVTIIDKKGGLLTVDINMKIHTKPARESVALSEGVVEFKGVYQFRQITIPELTPWLSMPIKDYSKEVYPR